MLFSHRFEIMKPRLFALLAIVILFPAAAFAQRIIEPGGFWYETEYTSESIADAEPDSVYYFGHWGSGDFDEEDDADIPVEILLKCRNLQKLVLRSCSVATILANLDQFPLLQELELWDNNLGAFPEKIALLKNLRSLTISDVSFVNFDREKWQNNQIAELYLTKFDSECTPEGEVCVLDFGVFPNLTYLSLDNSNISNLASLSKCVALKKLEVNNCEYLQTLGFDFGALAELSDLRLSNLPQLSEAPQGLGELLTLTSVSIERCGFDVSSEMFEGCESLESFSLSDNPVVDLDFLNNMTALNMLSLEYISPEQCPVSLKNCENLTSLYMYRVPFTAFPAFVLDLKNLYKLTINNAEFNTLPAGISGLSQLYDLDLSFGELTTIEPGALNLPRLNYLNLNYNKVTSLPSLAAMTELMSLSASGNQLSTLPVDIAGLVQLRYMDLEANQLTSLPAGLGSLASLYNIDLDENKISALPADLFKGPSLTVVSVKRNGLKTCPKSLSASPALKTLYLNGNKGIKLPKKMNAPKLEEIHLASDDLAPKDLTKLKAKLGEKIVISDY